VSHSDARPGEDGHEPLGSVGEEAAKLFEALQDWARDSAGGERHTHPGAGGGPGGAECSTWCPVCRAAQLVRQTSPEVRAHLTVAASSLLQAAAGLLAGAQAPPTSGAGVQKIDLDDVPDDEPGWDAD
jgi:hypothetical protein